MKRSSFRKKSYEEIISAQRAKNDRRRKEGNIPKLRTNSRLKAKSGLKRTRIRLVGHSTTAELKKEVQSLLREIVIKRDGGCFLRNYRDEINNKYLDCGWTRNDGEIILQAEHLHSRSNANSFSDSRLVVCCCIRHHFYYKKEFPDEYYKFAKRFIGKKNTELLEKVQQDRTPHKVDLKLEILALKQELSNL